MLHARTTQTCSPLTKETDKYAVNVQFVWPENKTTHYQAESEFCGNDDSCHHGAQFLGKRKVYTDDLNT